MSEPKVFVEALDRAFENVCELDLVFHFDEVGLRENLGYRTLSHGMGQGSPYHWGDHPRRPRPRNQRGGD